MTQEGKYYLTKKSTGLVKQQLYFKEFHGARPISVLIPQDARTFDTRKEAQEYLDHKGLTDFKITQIKNGKN